MATHFLHATGTNGLLVSAFAIVDSTDLDSLTNGSAVTSATGVHSNGQFSQTDTGSAQYGYVMLTVGNPGWTPTAGGCLTGWFMLSQDGGSNFETSNATARTTEAAVARPPDFVIPLEGAALSTGTFRFSPLIRLPWTSCKTLVQNNSGATLGNGGTTHATLKIIPVADQY